MVNNMISTMGTLGDLDMAMDFRLKGLGFSSLLPVV